MRFRLALQGQHVGMAVDDAGRRGQQGGDTRHLRLERARLCRGQLDQVLDAVGDRGLMDAGKLAELVGGCGDEQLRAALGRHAMALAEVVHLLLAFDAQPRAQAAGRVVNARVDHLAVARGGLGPDQVVLFEHQHLLAGHRQGARDREPDSAGPHNNRFDIGVHPSSGR